MPPFFILEAVRAATISLSFFTLGKADNGMPTYNVKKPADVGAYRVNRGQGMLLNMMCNRQLSALSLCLAVIIAPLSLAWADEPELVPTDSSATMSVQPTILSQPLDQSPATAIMAGIRPCLPIPIPHTCASSC